MAADPDRRPGSEDNVPRASFLSSQTGWAGGKPFELFKLRTMHLDADAADRKITAVGDDRFTPAGQLLRKFKIDELPQFWNVLRGDMSIVGPRSEDWDTAE